MAEVSSQLRRIESSIQVALASILQMEFKGTSLGFVTITGVNVSPDLSFAKIYVVSHDEAAHEEMVNALNQELKSLRYKLAKKINLRKMPKLRFYHDESIAKGARICELLSEG